MVLFCNLATLKLALAMALERNISGKIVVVVVSSQAISLIVT